MFFSASWIFKSENKEEDLQTITLYAIKEQLDE